MMTWMRILNASWWIALLILTGTPVYRDFKECKGDFDELSEYSIVWCIVVGVALLVFMLGWTVWIYLR